MGAAFSAYAGAIEQLHRQVGDQGFPRQAELNGLHPAPPVRFVDATAPTPALDYERRIVGQGEVAVRADDWHDVMNVLCWWRWPQLKTALSASHVRQAGLGPCTSTGRGALRDATTLLDESGLIIFSRNRHLNEALIRKDWLALFVAQRDALLRDWWCIPCGHALLEKCLRPFRGITAKCWLVEFEDLDRLRHDDVALATLDERLAADWSASGDRRAVIALPPMPLAGLPGWWPGNDVPEFYQDKAVFRPPRS